MSLFITLEQSTRATLGDWDDPLYYIYPGCGTISMWDSRDHEQKVGVCRYSIIHGTAAIERRVPPFQVADQDSDLLGMLHAELFDPTTNDLRESVIQVLAGEPMDRDNILVIERLALIPSCRGHNIAAHVLQYLMQHAGIGVGITALCPRPLQCFPRELWNEDGLADLGLDHFEPDEATATLVLQAYFRRQGFHALEEDESPLPFMVRSMNFGNRPLDPITLPSLDVSGA